MNRPTAIRLGRAALLSATALLSLPALASKPPLQASAGEAGFLSPVELIDALIFGDEDRRGHNRHHNRHDNRGRWDRRHGSRREYRAREYASEATAQANTAYRRGCRVSGPRWSLDWGDHYRWALDSRPRELRREIHRRADRLNRCRLNQRHYSRDRWHDHDDRHHGRRHDSRREHRREERRERRRDRRHGRWHRDGRPQAQ